MRNNSLLVSFTLVGILSGGFFALEGIGASEPDSNVVVRQVNANLLRVQVDGQWEEVPLMPLADHLCRSRNQLFKRYCREDASAPQRR